MCRGLTVPEAKVAVEDVACPLAQLEHDGETFVVERLGVAEHQRWVRSIRLERNFADDFHWVFANRLKVKYESFERTDAGRRYFEQQRSVVDGGVDWGDGKTTSLFARFGLAVGGGAVLVERTSYAVAVLGGLDLGRIGSAVKTGADSPAHGGRDLCRVVDTGVVRVRYAPVEDDQTERTLRRPTVRQSEDLAASRDASAGRRGDAFALGFEFGFELSADINKCCGHKYLGV